MASIAQGVKLTMQKIFTGIAILISFGIGFMVGQIILIKTQKPNQFVSQVVNRSLDKYSIDNLTKDWNTRDVSATLNMTKLIKDYPNFTSSEFIMNANLNKVSGLINIPKKDGKYPLVVMIRGFVPTREYFTGNGTINASIFFANNGFITIAPDFLGYGDSSPEPTNIFEARFQTYTVMMSLLDWISKSAHSSAVLADRWDGKNIFIWAHSNGGQIALTTLEITGVNYPTVLWAPVSAPFPFSILYYSDEVADHGKFLRNQTAQFEDVYNSDLYSLTNYLNKIEAPIQLDQGTADTNVPVSWSDNLVKSLKSISQEAGRGLKQVIYNVYQGADHQMTPLWNTVIQKDLEFFKTNLKD